MNEYVIYFTLFTLVIGAFSSLKLCFHKNTSNVLIGEGLLAIIVATFLIVINEIYYIGFAQSVALFLLICGPVGTLAFSKTMIKGNSKVPIKEN
ncbi:hypothetical protein [Methanococcus voltae]|uniref:Energy-converting hydrogenase B subunit B n=1 Tax=Methanococcus voltae PS TaxID=523842 RepID=A0ABT2EXM6_METVO|nr:hypothetical protein [Methanococcus voltae]MBP2171713.1 energy-converting hydrogenase B subunit B [Methanococcus voltae]MCS3922709.1 energy-converting hydrogenase B subunit B [Methanococcus voltae PS]